MKTQNELKNPYSNVDEVMIFEYEKFKYEQRLTALHFAKEEILSKGGHKITNVDDVIELANRYLVFLEHKV